MTKAADIMTAATPGRCVCSHQWTDHMTWCYSSGCPCKFTPEVRPPSVRETSERLGIVTDPVSRRSFVDTAPFEDDVKSPFEDLEDENADLRMTLTAASTELTRLRTAVNLFPLYEAVREAAIAVEPDTYDTREGDALRAALDALQAAEDALRAITDKRTAPGTWRTWHGDDDYAMNAYAVTSEPCDHEYTDDDGHHRHVIALTLLQHPRLASLGHTGDPDAMLWSENTAAIVAMDHTYEALLAVADSLREALQIHEAEDLGYNSSCWCIEAIARLAALDARTAEVTK